MKVANKSKLPVSFINDEILTKQLLSANNVEGEPGRNLKVNFFGST
jgi:hypothetical protein